MIIYYGNTDFKYLGSLIKSYAKSTSNYVQKIFWGSIAADLEQNYMDTVGLMLSLKKAGFCSLETQQQLLIKYCEVFEPMSRIQHLF